MERFTYKGKNQRTIELFLLVVYTIYSCNMIFLSVDNDWGTWVSLVLMGSWAFCCIVTLARFRTYEFRTTFVAWMIQISLSVYAMNVDGVMRILPIFITFVVILGLYGIEKVLYTTVISATYIFCYHRFVLDTFVIETFGDNISMLVQLLNVYFVEYLVYMWTRRNREGSEELLGTIDKLKELQNSKDDFLANVSHEIRTPINTIYGLSEVILSEKLPDKVKDDILGIQQAGRNLTAVVRDILDFSELQTGNIELEEEAYNIASTINDVVNMTLARKNGKEIEIIVDCDARIPCGLLGDEKKLRRVIMNLVDNAIKFTDEGYVSIGVGFREESYGINLIITVTDTGIGMDEKSLEKLFDSFNQVDTSRKRQEGGIGLGLAISYALTKKMGAALTVKSKLGKGTVVKVVVPQKVLDKKPVAALEDRANINVATYIDMEQFHMVEIRDEYSKNIIHMVEQLNGRCHICRNFLELQRRVQSDNFSHVFISDVEYRAKQEYFDKLAKDTKLVVILDYEDEKYVTNPDILKIYKPYYILSIVSALNGQKYVNEGDELQLNSKFTTLNAHVLVVDDNKMNLRVIEGFLKDYKINVTTAISGKEALKKIETKNFDFVFMDHMMPEMDGVETLHNIRNKVGTYYQKVPIVALTANAVAGSRESLLAQGFDDFLEKPIERSVLERVLKRNIPSEKLVYEQEDKIEEDIIVTDEELSVVSLERMLTPKGIDVGKGIVYCNGKDRYIDILKSYCEENSESGILAEELFEKKDWKNYTIAVHGMKSSMRSIGASQISQLAADLEAAGHKGDIQYIIENHNRLISQYKKLFDELCKFEWLAPKKEVTYNEPEIEYETIEDTKFDGIIADMEIAMYTLDKDILMELISELQGYKYNETPLKEQLVPVVRKIEMSDYISAVEMVAKIKTKLSGKEE